MKTSLSSRVRLSVMIIFANVLIAAPAASFDFGPGPVFPDVELVSYREKIGQVPLTQLFFAGADVTLRVSNKGKDPTDPVSVNITDNNVLMITAGVVSVPSLKAGVAKNITVHMKAMLPPPTSQTPEEQQYSQWNQWYRERCGVDLSVELDSPNGHHSDYLYQGYGDSKPWQENRPLGDKVICDDKNCVSMSQVSRSIYKQLGCKVVGYASFVGDRISGVSGKFQAYGKARTSLNPPATNFAPTTKMQVSSTAKVITALAGIRAFGSHIEDLAFKNFPSNWKLPQSTIVKNITFREFLSQTSGIQQYGTGDGNFSALEKFFEQSLKNPSAAPNCGSLTNPIIANKAPCYSNINFGIMRLLIPRFAGESTNDPHLLAKAYVKQTQDKVFTPVGVQNVACRPPASPSGYAFVYKYPGDKIGGDWGDLTDVSGDWGWFLSVEDYARVLISLNSGDHKILGECQYYDMENKPASHPVGWDISSDGAGHRWLEKNGGDGMNGAGQSTAVGIYGGRSGGCGHPAPVPGVVGALFINSDIHNQPNVGADTVLLKAFQSATKPKP